MNYKVIIINLIIFLVGLLIIEAIFGNWFKEDKSRYLNVIKNYQVTIKGEDLYYDEPKIKEITYTRDQFGLRGNYGNPKDIQILTVGGSTTDQRFINDGSTWQDELERILVKSGYNLKIANAGIDGQSTFGHIKNFSLWLNHIPGLKPRYCLFYVGINDFYKESITMDEKDVSPSLAEMIKVNSCIYYAFNTIRSNLQTHGTIKIAHQKVDFRSVEWTEEGMIDSSSYDAIMAAKAEAYKSRLRVLAKLCLDRGIQPVFITQPSRMFKTEDGKISGTREVFTLDGVTYNGKDFYHMFGIFNQAAKDFCSESNLPCIDVMNDLPLTDADFYDYSHNTPMGASKIGEFIAERFISITAPR